MAVEVSNVKKRKLKSDDSGSGTDDELDAKGEKVPASYECRFCEMRFAKSQALGGHMNRHRQEREKEQYQQARELVSQMQQQPRWNTLLTERNAAGAVAMARMGQFAPARSGPPRADDTAAGQMIGTTRLVSYNSASSQSSMPIPPPSLQYNADSDCPFSCNTRLASYNSSASSQILPQLHHQPSTTMTSNAGSNINAGGFSWLDFITQPGAAAARMQGSSLGMPAPINAIEPSDGTIVLQGSAMRDEFLTSVSQPRQDAAAAANYAGAPAIFTSMQRNLGSGNSFGHYAL